VGSRAGQNRSQKSCPNRNASKKVFKKLPQSIADLVFDKKKKRFIASLEKYLIKKNLFTQWKIFLNG
jgi:hypothetical protein